MISEIAESDDEEETLDDPMEIDFVQRKEPATSLATIPCKIKCLKIPALVLNKKYDLSSVATVPTKSIGIARNFPITFPPDWGKDELKIPFNGKDHIIPVTMHKVKNKLEVNCATVAQDDKSSVSDQISQEAECDEDKNVPLEKWCAPVNFSLDSTTLKKNA
ncbi:1304_t:CDS:2 [Entrophospora sp. SA101]|nr:1304_t:CDS:2 [Entrophospora sp. SA101]